MCFAYLPFGQQNLTAPAFIVPGGDQGLLNQYFSQWSQQSECRLPFVYNVVPGVYYSYVGGTPLSDLGEAPEVHLWPTQRVFLYIVMLPGTCRRCAGSTTTSK